MDFNVFILLALVFIDNILSYTQASEIRTGYHGFIIHFELGMSNGRFKCWNIIVRKLSELDSSYVK